MTYLALKDRKNVFQKQVWHGVSKRQKKKTPWRELLRPPDTCHGVYPERGESPDRRKSVM